MDYFKATLSGLTALILAVCVPVWPVFRGISNAKATGIAAVAGGLAETATSPLFWLLAIVLFALFFLTSRLGSKLLRIILFWIPTVTVSTLGIATVALYAGLLIYVFSRAAHS
jgi:hypothetical protein